MMYTKIICRLKLIEIFIKTWHTCAQNRQNRLRVIKKNLSSSLNLLDYKFFFFSETAAVYPLSDGHSESEDGREV